MTSSVSPGNIRVRIAHNIKTTQKIRNRSRSPLRSRVIIPAADGPASNDSAGANSSGMEKTLTT
ncbi:MULTISPECIES: hypothetical protein [unclassified Phaeobacter]|uniref:hypothetical protein n=1 Tax=unclassified Phaeobacter TaxID=2621772 RepID=UPI003A847A6E